MIILLLLLEFIVFIILGILYVVKLIQFARQSVKIKQADLRRRGHMLALVGIVIGIGLPNVLGIENNFSESANIVYFLVTMVGTCILLVGWRFILASYQTKEETPHWIRRIMSLWGQK